MRAGPSLLIALICLALLAPTVGASGGVTLTRSVPVEDESEVTVTGNEAVAFQTEYTLDLGEPMALRMLTRFDAFGPTGAIATDHSAAWTVDGQSVGSSSRTTTSSTTVLAEGTHTVRIVWSLGEIPEATYKLAATMREAASGTSGTTATGTASSDRDEMLLRVVRESDTSTSTSSTTTTTSESTTSSTASTTSSTTSTTSTTTTQPPSDQTAPPQVTGLTVSDATHNSLRLTWTPVSDPSGVRYEVYVSDGPVQSGAETIVAAPTQPTFQHTGLTPSTSYFYRVLAVDGANNKGAASAQVEGRTLDEPDTSAPSAVTGLHVTRRTEDSAALAWDPATDNRGVLTYRVARDGAILDSTSATRFTDDGLAPGDRPLYTVRAIDAAGNVGPAAAVQAAAYEAPIPVGESPPPLTITRVGVRVEGRSARIDWTTDETASGDITVGASRVRVASGVDFTATFAPLLPGEHTYVIEMATSDGRTASRTGTFTVAADPGHGQAPASSAQESAPANVVVGLEGVFGLQLDDAAISVADTDDDGIADALRDDSGTLKSVQGFSRQRLILVEVAATGALAIVSPDGRTAEPVVRQPSTVRGEETQEELRKLVIDVPEKAGWIVVDVVDTDPDQPILAVLAGNGTALPRDSAWRANGVIRFIDDPSVQYTIVFDHAGFVAADDANDGSGASSGGGGWPLSTIVLAVLVGILSVAVIVLARRRIQ